MKVENTNRDMNRRGYQDALAGYCNPVLCKEYASYRLGWFNANLTGEVIPLDLPVGYHLHQSGGFSFITA